MRVTLVYPYYGHGKRSLYFPLGLAYIASVLRESENKVTVVDMEGDDLSNEEAVSQILASAPDLIGFGGMITRFRIVKTLAQSLRKEMPSVFMIAGNSGATTVPELYLKSCLLDAVVLGEGEITTRELATALENSLEWKNIPGLAYLSAEGKLLLSPARELIENLDSIPFPAWDLFPVERYVSSLDHRQIKVRHLEVVASRGCPFNCVYCYRIYGRSVRRRSPESIVSEVEELVSRYNIEYTSFPDDLFTSDRNFVMDTCRLISERLPDLRWSCIGRVNTVDREMLKTMNEAGCEWISYGVESGNNRMLSIMKRGVTAQQCLDSIRLTRESGIHPEGSFMIGMFGETEESVRDTVEFCKKADITAPMLYVTPYPGTEIFNRAINEKLISNVEEFLEKMNAADELLVNLTDLSDEKLASLRNWAQGTIGRNYLMKKPLTRIPSLIVRHIALGGLKGLAHDIRAFLASLGGSRRTSQSV